MAEPLHILATRRLDEESEDMCLRMGYRIDTVSFIAVEALNDIQTIHKISQAALQPHTVIFTSANAVQAVSECTQGSVSDWDVYAIGQATLERVQQMMPGQPVKGTAPDATRLAECVIADRPQAPVVFFCGDQRREELPQLLQGAGMRIEEIVVYHTTETAVAVEPVHDALLFFSPSAVKSFFSLNQPKKKAVFFAIGETTAAEIRKHTDNEVVVSRHPSVRELSAALVSHFEAYGPQP